MIIFTTNTNLSFLCYCEEWYMDGTFDVVPTIFNQLYTIHGKKNKKNKNGNNFKQQFLLEKRLGRRNKTYLPLVYVLATGKDFFTYAEIFSKLKDFQPRLNPKRLQSRRLRKYFRKLRYTDAIFTFASAFIEKYKKVAFKLFTLKMKNSLFT